MGTKLSERVAGKLPIILADYAKRVLERYYDVFFKTPIGLRIKNLPALQKQFAEAAIYTMHSVFEDKLAGNSGISKFLGEVAGDIPSEFCRRMINGDIGADAHCEPDTSPLEIPRFTRRDREEVAKWLAGLSERDRQIIKEEISQAAANVLPQVIAQDKQAMHKINVLFMPENQGILSKIFKAIIGDLNGELDSTNRMLEDKIGRMRVKRGKK